MTLSIKICGLTTVEAVRAAQEAEYNGFVFYSSSPRNLDINKAVILRNHVKKSKTVAVTVDPSDALLTEIIEKFSPHYIQLHGSETYDRVQEIKDAFHIPVIKALRVASPDDIIIASEYEKLADMLLFDAKVANGLPGGNGISFDWKMLAGKIFSRPWFLSGGITLHNVTEAIKTSNASAIDASSALETLPGIKSPDKIKEFIHTLKDMSLR